MLDSHRLAAPIALMLALAPLGCSLSTSSGSISDSVSSPSNSSSKSSKSRAQSYADDVRDYTAGYVTGGGSTPEGLRYGLVEVAKRHGITNWTASMDSFVGVGMGLAKAGIAGSQYLGYRDGLTGRDSGKAAAVDRGYRSGGN